MSFPVLAKYLFYSVDCPSSDTSYQKLISYNQKKKVSKYQAEEIKNSTELS